ncbi:MAG: ATP-binding protein [Parachlamydiales bacterium]|nr:ATP-binding protein [Parachlamydiales bacterium]
MLKRIYENFIKNHFKENRQMLFISGPRQVGKTTTTLLLKKQKKTLFYFSWDNIEQKELILKGPNELVRYVNNKKLRKTTPYLIFDEIHKFKNWKTFLKGLYDTYPNEFHIIVTGSARLNFFKKGGDSLMGRYFLFRFHPLSVAEILSQTIIDSEIRKTPKSISSIKYNNLLKFGGYPDPFIKKNIRFYNQWKKLKSYQLFQGDLQDLSKIEEIGKIELLAELLKRQVGQLVTYNSIAKKIRVSSNTVRNWIKSLQALFYCFEVRPYSKNISKSLLKEPKYYLWDWSLCEDEGQKAENFVASHLLKAIQFWTDYGFGEYQLYFLRDKSKREVDFLITKDNKPWILAEVKKSDDHFSNSLEYFQKKINCDYVFQIVVDAPYIDKNCFINKNPLIVPAKTFLSQLI